MKSALHLQPNAAPHEPTLVRNEAEFAARVRESKGELRRRSIKTLQVNIGARCNLACHHCHVESGPNRREAMSRSGAERVLELLAKNPTVETLDLTGGAPEMNENFRFLVAGARRLGRRVIDRCNLTIFYEPGHDDTPEFLAEERVEIVASLPCYSAENVEKQRGRGVFRRSIDALQWLGRLGYGEEASGLRLDLVYNPVGPFLPPKQSELEAQYRSELLERYGIRFGRLLTITNMPIKRFAHDLEREGRYEEYLELLVNHFNPATVEALMCRDQLSVSWDGRLYDCDFNQQLGIEIPSDAKTLWDVDDLTHFADSSIATAPHCFGCTAGAGSSCGGALDRTSA